MASPHAFADRPRPGSPDAPSATFLAAVRELQDAAYARAVDGPGLHVLAPLLRGRLALRAHTVDLALDALSRDAVHLLLTHGWSPAELHAFARRRLDPAAMSYLLDALAAAAQVTVAAPWRAELAQLGAHVWWSVGRSHTAQWAARHGHKRVEAIRVGVEVLALLCHIPRTESPVPGAPSPLPLEPGTLVHDKRIAAKIDALLARAGDSSFPEEAAACAAKAQELMVRYATVPDIAAGAPVSATASAAIEQLLAEGPAVVAKTIFSGMRLGLSLLTDPRRLATTVSAEMAHLVQKLATSLPSVVPALPGRPAARPALDA